MDISTIGIKIQFDSLPAATNALSRLSTQSIKCESSIQALTKQFQLLTGQSGNINRLASSLSRLTQELKGIGGYTLDLGRVSRSLSTLGNAFNELGDSDFMAFSHESAPQRIEHFIICITART